MSGFDRFELVWSSGGPSSPPTLQQANLGWDYIGANPPTVQQFNAVFRWMDEKDNWLFGQLSEVMSAAGITAAESPSTQLLSALQTLFPDQDLSYLYNSINEVVTSAGLTVDNVTPNLWDAILAHFATKVELATRVLRTGDTMPYLSLSADPSSGDRAARRSWVEAQVSPKVNRSGDTMPYLAVTDAPSDWARVTNKAYVDGANNFNVNGYHKTPSGLMFQWGTVAAATRTISSTVGISFPTGFPNYCAAVIPAIETPDAGLLDMQPGFNNLNQWGCNLLAGTSGPWNEGEQSRYFGWRWIAVGF